jgi:myosin heavy subunit
VCDVEVGSAVNNNDVIDAYELRVEELGHLMLEQGRHLDQLTDRNRRLSTENIALRGKVSENFTTSMSFCTPETTSPLKSVMNQKKGSIEGQGKMQKQKEQNALLHSQAELLVKELAHSNNQISEMDMTIASLEKELKEIWELSRQCKI